MENAKSSDEAISCYVSTGRLPPSLSVGKLVEEAHQRYRHVAEGRNAQVYPALARVSSELFGVAVVENSGLIHQAGDSGVLFSLMSASKPLVVALVCEVLGTDAFQRRVGVNATGLPFDSLEALDRDERTNPMVNPGAICATSLAPGSDLASRWSWLHEGLCQFAGRTLRLSDEVYQSAMDTNVRNREIARRLEQRGQLATSADEAVELYTRQCSLEVTAVDLAVMGATLADGGVNPLTRQRVVGLESCRAALSTMVTAGLYENSGKWLFETGLPGKSGISGGIMAVAPGKGALATFSPPLDTAGNSVRGQLAAKFLSRSLGLDIFLSQVEGG